MIEDVMIKSHLIITDIHEEYDVKWHGRIIDTNPFLKNGMPIFVIIGSTARMELNTISMKEIEDCAKRLTEPRGRTTITSDKAYIYIKEQDKKETLIGTVIHRRVKKYAPMFDTVGFQK